MIRSLFVTSLLVLCASGCQSPGYTVNEHWKERSVPPRITRFFTGYDASKDGQYLDFQWVRKKQINLTLRRHFLNSNPDNPNQPPEPSRFEPRPPNTPFPNPLPYLQGLGLDSVIATVSTEKGWDEFVSGPHVVLGEVGIVATTFLNTWVKPPLAGAITEFHDIVGGDPPEHRPE